MYRAMPLANIPASPARADAGAGLVLALGLALGLALATTAQAAPGAAGPTGTAASVSNTGTPAAATAPVAAGDDMEKLLADKGIISQITVVSQSVTQKVSNKAGELVVTAMGFLGVPYKRGGNNFDTGFDCSGFVKAMYEQTVGLVLPRKAEQQAAATQQIDKADLQPGDLVFFNTLRRAFSHVGIYVGDGKFIHSPKPGAEVRVEDMQKAYWTRRFDGARRVEGAKQAAAD